MSPASRLWNSHAGPRTLAVRGLIGRAISAAVPQLGRGRGLIPSRRKSRTPSPAVRIAEACRHFFVKGPSQICHFYPNRLSGNVCGSPGIKAAALAHGLLYNKDKGAETMASHSRTLGTAKRIRVRMPLGCYRYAWDCRPFGFGRVVAPVTDGSIEIAPQVELDLTSGELRADVSARRSA